MSEISKGNLKFDQQSQTECPIPLKDAGKVGVSYARQNFYFHSSRKDTEKLIMRYEHLSEQREDFFEVNMQIRFN